jgi:hypothetical protein
MLYHDLSDARTRVLPYRDIELNFTGGGSVNKVFANTTLTQVGIVVKDIGTTSKAYVEAFVIGLIENDVKKEQAR